LSGLRLRALSGLDAKAPACFVVEAGGTRLMLDLGRVGAAAPDLRRAGPVNAVLLSHQHPDHAGALDGLDRLGQPPIHATEAVAAALGIAARPLPLRGRTCFGGVVVTTGLAGHAPGAIWLHLAAEGDTLLYCGDVEPTGAAYPFEPPPMAETVVIDASYGLDLTPPDARARIVERVLTAEGPALLPAPASGRGLEMALALHEAGRAPALCTASRAKAQEARRRPDVLRPQARATLAALLDVEAPDPGLALVDDPTLSGAPAREAAERALRAGGLVLFTGDPPAGSPAAALVREGRAEVARWPAHPDLAANAALLRRVGARRVLPAFCAPAVGDALVGRLGLERAVLAEPTS
jgi:glyoxylase-like metal-dependent hydrolase (beta-lactamase superfamily II)